MLTLFENSRPIFIEALLSILRFRWINFDLLNWPHGRKSEEGGKRTDEFRVVETKLRMDTIGKIDKSIRRCYYRITRQ